MYVNVHVAVARARHSQSFRNMESSFLCEKKKLYSLFAYEWFDFSAIAFEPRAEGSVYVWLPEDSDHVDEQSFFLFLHEIDDTVSVY